MPYEPPPRRVDEPRRSRRYWLHLGDNFFRHAIFYVVPLILVTALGVVLSQRATAEFQSTATVDASSNPLVQNLAVSESSAFFRPPSQITASFINDQLSTDVFTTAVGQAAGLNTDVVELAAIRRSIGASANGDSLVVIGAAWANPQTAQLLAQATIDTYRITVVNSVAADSIAAEDFFRDLQGEAETIRTDAEGELSRYLAGLPPVSSTEDYTVAEQLEIQRLTSSLERADTNVETAKDQIQQAQLRVAQIQSEAGESIRLIDPPSLPIESKSQLLRMVSLVIVFFLLGVIVAIAALLVTTAFDRTVRFDLDVIESSNSTTVASVKTIKALSRRPISLLRSAAPDQDLALDDEGASDDVGTTEDGVEEPADASDDDPPSSGAALSDSRSR